MTGSRVKSLSIEVEHEEGAGTIVVRDPLGDGCTAYVAGELPLAIAEDTLQALGIGAFPLLVAGGMHDSARSAPSRPGVLRAAEAPLSRPSSPLSSHSSRMRSPASLADLLDELAHAILRTGRQNPTTTVDELLDGAWLAGGVHLPLARVLGRLEATLSPEAPAAEAALALAALAELAARLRNPADAMHLELVGRTPSRPLDPCQLLELGRRRERGSVGAETRLILDLSSGELLCEVQSRPGTRLSRGPVGRHLSVTFGRRHSSVGPPRVDIQHYEYDPAPTAEHLERVAALASSGVNLPSDGGLSLIPHPEPALVQLKSLDAAAQCVDCLNGTRLALGDGSCPGVVRALLDVTMRGARVDVLLGTLELLPHTAGRSSLLLVPWSAIVQSESGTRRLVPLSY